MFTRNFKMYEWYEFTYKWRIVQLKIESHPPPKNQQSNVRKISANKSLVTKEGTNKVLRPKGLPKM